MSLNPYYRTQRSIIFREMVEEIRASVSFLGFGPLDLRLSTLRRLWSTAQFSAETQQFCEETHSFLAGLRAKRKAWEKQHG